MRSAFSAPGKHVGLHFACVSAAVIALLVLPSTARAQNFADSSKWEIGGHYAFLNLPSQCTSGAMCQKADNGLGANLAYNFSTWLGLDAEMNFFGNNGNAPTATTGGNATEGLFGLRFGPTTRRWGLYSVMRPGFLNFSRVLNTSTGAAPLLTPMPGAYFAAGSAPSAEGAPQISATLRYQAAASSNPLAVLGVTSATYFALNYGEEIEYRATKHAALRLDIGDTIVAYPGATLGAPFHQHNFQISEAIVIRF
ncbi:MAG TPA: outer membrane beta-barrel protein [Candidatus Acidoferrales bacterium]|nr:outer membrane beta-barrel protein [Candidatus Acidoferrales bacterium]